MSVYILILLLIGYEARAISYEHRKFRISKFHNIFISKLGCQINGQVILSALSECAKLACIYKILFENGSKFENFVKFFKNLLFLLYDKSKN